MTSFQPVLFRTARGYEFHVSSLHDVVKALAMAWPSKDCEFYRSAACLAEQAGQGWCTPRVAFDAFVVAADKQKRIVQRGKLRDRVARELAAMEPDNFNPPGIVYPARLRMRLTRKSVARSHKSHI
ncbi:MAG TPA: DUF982 domain-containing protein [Mesorhizobium sp.]|jgi:hypothetical protein|uniref:DUF982 domain-containing protein n=1 Tax=Mesorhizobium sp. TaxID=1871066 RepID=UPI002DDD73BC|nr:DUF982 domain-containing protein [Mesorhizobium sp.]HEV2505956.1 DUF982 domain-containing protein [Mesorhizobium sp.]